MQGNYRILTTGSYGEKFERLARSMDINCDFIEEDQLKEVMSEYNVLASMDIPSNLNLNNFKWIHSFKAGVDHIVARGDILHNPIISRTVGNMGRRIAEYCLAYSTYFLKDIDGVIQNQKLKKWERKKPDDLYLQKVLIFGTGSIGRSIGETFQPLVHEVCGVDRTGDNKSGFDKVLKRQDINGDFDIVINALPGSANTKNYFDAELLSLFNDIIFINVGRGSAIRPEVLQKALKSGIIRKAILDVFVHEPLAEQSELWEDPDVIVTPHYAGMTTWEDVEISFKKVCEQIETGNINDLIVQNFSS